MNFNGCMGYRYHSRYFEPLRFVLRDNKVKAKFNRKRELAFTKYLRSFEGNQLKLIRGKDY